MSKTPPPLSETRDLSGSDDEIAYGQFCPVAKAAEIVTTRWTLLILRELISGSHRFNEIHRGVPLMSRGLLSKRLKDLEKWRVIKKEATGDKEIPEYHLTESGQQLGPIIVALGQWGGQWVESAADSDDWDAAVLMWDVKRRIDRAALPDGRTVIHFEFEDATLEMRLWWCVIDESGVDLCQQDPGFEIDLYINTDVRTLAEVWIGKRPLRGAIDDGSIMLTGDKTLCASIDQWLLLALMTEMNEKPETAGA